MQKTDSQGARALFCNRARRRRCPESTYAGYPPELALMARSIYLLIFLLLQAAAGRCNHPDF